MRSLRGPDDGWVFGPELWSTHDGGAHWSMNALMGVWTLEATDGRVHAVASGTDGNVHHRVECDEPRCLDANGFASVRRRPGSRNRPCVGAHYGLGRRERQNGRRRRAPCFRPLDQMESALRDDRWLGGDRRVDYLGARRGLRRGDLGSLRLSGPPRDASLLFEEWRRNVVPQWTCLASGSLRQVSPVPPPVWP